MNAFVGLLFCILWLAAGFCACLLTLCKVVAARQAAVLSALLVAVCALGAYVPRHLIREASNEPAAPTAVSAPALRKEHGVNCSSVPLPIAADGRGSMDVVRSLSHGTLAVLKPNAPVGRSSELQILGWATDPLGSVVASGVCVVIDGRIRPNASIEYGGNRPDVAAFFKNPAITGSGFRAALRLEDVAPGSHVLRIVSIASRRASYVTGTLPFVVRS